MKKYLFGLKLKSSYSIFEVVRLAQGIFLSQRKFVLDLLVKFEFLDCKPANTPIVQNHRFGKSLNPKPANRKSYQRLVSKVIYLFHAHPNIAYAVSAISRFMHSPSNRHMKAMMWIFRYLKGSTEKGLLSSKNNHLNIDGYIDADWAGDLTTRRSILGYFTFVGCNLIIWRNKKQKVVALSSVETKFRGMPKGVCEVLWLKKLITDIDFTPKSEMNLFCDNRVVVDISI